MPTLTQPIPARAPSPDRAAGTEPDAAQPAQPNLLRRVGPVAGLAAGVAAMVLTFGGPLDGTFRSISQRVYDVLHGADVQKALKRPFAEVKADLETGEISRGDVVVVRAPRAESTWDEATQLAGGSQPVEPIDDILVAQQGGHLDAGEPAIVSRDIIDSPG